MVASTPSSQESSASGVRARLYEKYRSFHSSPDAKLEREQRAAYIRHFIGRHIPANRNIRILELGCGSGVLLHFLKEAGYQNVLGVESSPEQIERAESDVVEEIEEEDAFSFLRQTKTGTFDVVIAFDMIEHLTKTELFDLADEVYRTLTPHGLWIIHAPNAEAAFGSRIRYADLTHEQAFTRESIEQLTCAVGFRATRCFEDVPVVHGFLSLLRRMVWEAIRLLLRIYVMAETGDRGRDAVFSQNLLSVARK